MERVSFTDYLRALIERYHREHPETRRLVLPLDSDVRPHQEQDLTQVERFQLLQRAQDRLRYLVSPRPASGLH